MSELITNLVKTVQAKTAIELGTQQGHSAILLAKGGARVRTYDLFEEKYPKPPHKATHANYMKALENTFKYDIHIGIKDVFKVKPVNCDILHIDICNHKHNVNKLVRNWFPKVSKLIILEGGILNKWQKKYGFKPFIPKMKHIILKGENGYAITIITK